MNTKEIIASIQKRRSDGLTDEQIIANLINQGLTDEEVDRLIKLSYQSPEKITEEIKSTEPPKKKGWWPF